MGEEQSAAHNESLSPSFLRLNGWLGCKKVAEERRKWKKGRTLTLLWRGTRKFAGTMTKLPPPPAYSWKQFNFTVAGD